MLALRKVISVSEVLDLIIFSAFILTFIITVTFVRGMNKIWSVFVIGVFFIFIGYSFNLPYMGISTVSILILLISMLIVYKLFLSENTGEMIE